MRSSLKLYTILRGGVGNQIFQYLFMRTLQISYAAEIFFDLSTGFRLDRQAKRGYELNDFMISCQKYEKSKIIPMFIGEKLSYRISHEAGKRYFGLLGTGLIYEPYPKFEEVKFCQRYSDFFVSGYWQSPMYFSKNWEEISSEFQIRWKPNQAVLNLSSKMNSENSVAIGMRNYFDSNRPEIHARGKEIVSKHRWEELFSKLEIELDSPVYYVFNLDFGIKPLLEFGIPESRLCLVPKNLTDKSVHRLFLFSSSRNHAFNNSSFYWWGAYLRKVYFDSSDQRVFASDNFLNEDFNPGSWIPF